MSDISSAPGLNSALFDAPGAFGSIPSVVSAVPLPPIGPQNTQTKKCSALLHHAGELYSNDSTNLSLAALSAQAVAFQAAQSGNEGGAAVAESFAGVAEAGALVYGGSAAVVKAVNGNIVPAITTALGAGLGAASQLKGLPKTVADLISDALTSKAADAGGNCE